MNKNYDYNERLYRSIGICKFFAENEGMKIKDAEEEFSISKSTIRKDIDFLAINLHERRFRDDPEKEKQIFRWYKKTREIMKKNHYARKK